MLALETTLLTKKYNNGFEALKGINLHVEQGDFFALLGANGAGKSTTIGLITTLLTKTRGTIKIFGHDLDTHPDQAKETIGLVPQEFNLNLFETCHNILVNQSGFYGITRKPAKIKADKLLEQLGLSDKRHTAIRHLSGGMKRRMMIARALVHEPKLLILDEPTAGVDIEIRRSMWAFLREINAHGTTIILTTHYLEEAEQMCRNVAIINHGEIIAHTSMEQILNEFNYQTFILNTATPLMNLPQIKEVELSLHEAQTLEAQIPRSMHLNQLFQLLTEHNIKVVSMRNKTNRLEELFLDLISHGH